MSTYKSVGKGSSDIGVVNASFDTRAICAEIREMSNVVVSALDAFAKKKSGDTVVNNDNHIVMADEMSQALSMLAEEAESKTKLIEENLKEIQEIRQSLHEAKDHFVQRIGELEHKAATIKSIEGTDVREYEEESPIKSALMSISYTAIGAFAGILGGTWFSGVSNWPERVTEAILNALPF